MAASLGYLQREPGRLIGLETMGESPSNLGLYLRQGFWLRFPTLLMAKRLEGKPRADEDLPRWSLADLRSQGSWLEDLREATGQIYPGLDYSKEITSTAQHGLGETLVLMREGRAVGMSVTWLTSGWEGWGEERASVQVLALHPRYTSEQTLYALLAATEGLAYAYGKRLVALPVNGRQGWVVEQLLGRGYRVEGAALRMTWRGTADGLTAQWCADLSRWAG